MKSLNTAEILPRDAGALLIGRVHLEALGGPVPVLVRDGVLHDISGLAPTVSMLLERDDLVSALDGAFPALGPIQAFLDGALAESGDRLLAPCDLQVLKAAGVTFASSMIERVVEEQAKGDPAAAETIRAKLAPVLGDSLRGLEPGSDKAMEVKRVLVEMGMWSQYLEVGIGPDAEVFTKAPVLSAMGCGARIGVHPKSHWNNPEPELVLAVDSRGTVRGVTLGNDVNLRDFEGRSALLLSKAKDNNASAAIGPFIRLFDAGFTMADAEKISVRLNVRGADDGFVMDGISPMSEISRRPIDIVNQTLNADHQYPDGFMLYLGTLFAPTQDRGAPGAGFTHKVGDRVEISAPELGALVNWVDLSGTCPPWKYGVTALMQSLSKRNLI
ncbi:fumarylacetoacetate hydrolase family protein [Paroceanicella profunda]|uniref:Fumarylacetoacetate hydrolase family protein n=1 Tax=Paroceanicella profunda TaxID=2579971 RepID=A0A5B8FHL8_9RHOB|nr:fumarylacetoacetate hydrolase family protein [Paroceanicella profunda]QDL92591.1 fumarylacetoacetate hydrolase family protein [Paroceanicella profunda]